MVQSAFSKTTRAFVLSVSSKELREANDTSDFVWVDGEFGPQHTLSDAGDVIEAQGLRTASGQAPSRTTTGSDTVLSATIIR